jgi:hypothetical protein
MKLSRESILSTLASRRSDLARFGVRRIGLFGSCARGEMTGDSDLDFLVELDRKSFDDYMGLKFFLEDLFSSRVDLVMPETLKPRLRSEILRETVYAA